MTLQSPGECGGTGTWVQRQTPSPPLTVCLSLSAAPPEVCETWNTCKHTHIFRYIRLISFPPATNKCVYSAGCVQKHKHGCVCVCVCVCSGVSPLHHEWIFLLHGELRVDLDGIVFILQLQQLLPAVLRHQLAVFNNIWNKEEEWQRYNSCSEQAREPQPNTDTENLNEDRHWL